MFSTSTPTSTPTSTKASTNYFNIVGGISVLIVLTYLLYYIDRIVSWLVFGLILVAVLYATYRYSKSDGQLQTIIPTRNEWMYAGIVIGFIVLFLSIGFVNKMAQLAIFGGVIYLIYKLYVDYGMSKKTLSNT